MMLLLTVFSLTVLAGAVQARPADIDTFTNVTIFDDGTSNPWYARTTTLDNGTLLATWSPASSVYRSLDNGFSWFSLAEVTSDTDGRTLVQPHLLTLNESIGDFDRGTVLLAVNAHDNSSTNIEVYASQDSGETWQFVSGVASGGKGNTTNGATPVWEPFLMVYNHRVICYYSDQRDSKHGQKLAHQTSQDLLTWSSAVDDVAETKYTDRPGMTTVAKLPNGKYILTFEYAQLNSTGDYVYPVHFRIASNPEKFNSEKSQPIVVSSGAQPDASPYVTWSSVGGPNGTIIVSDADNNGVFINRALGEGNWTEVKTPAGRAYSRELRIPANDPGKLAITGGVKYGSKLAQVLFTVMDFQKAVTALGG